MPNWKPTTSFKALFEVIKSPVFKNKQSVSSSPDLAKIKTELQTSPNHQTFLNNMLALVSLVLSKEPGARKLLDSINERIKPTGASYIENVTGTTEDLKELRSMQQSSERLDQLAKIYSEEAVRSLIAPSSTSHQAQPPVGGPKR